jgi:hypothetical protein
MAPSQANESDDPRYPITSRHGDNSLETAIKAVGRARPATDAEHAKVRRYIMKIAAQHGWSDDIPGGWQSDGSIKGGGS